MNGEWWTRRNSPQKISSGLGNALMLLVLLLAVWLRFWQLKAIPPGLWFDEAYYAMDAVWLRDTNTWPVFLLGNNGREAMFSYLLAWSTAVWGETAYIVRWVSAWLGVLAIPIMYRWVFTIFDQSPKARWLALISAAGLAVSFWYVTMNRSGYRANLLPLFILMVSYFFWRGWQTSQTRYYLLAGLGLGLSQYTYLSIRLFPLVFILFMFIQTVLSWRDEPTLFKTAWLRFCLMGGISVLVAIPLLLFFVDHPEALWGRVSEVAVKTDGSVEGLKAIVFHLIAAIRVFIDGEDPNWRHHLLGRPVFDWLSAVGFWLGLFRAIKQYRYPAYLFLLILLFVMWLPAPLSEPAVNTLRLSGILPVYYVFVAIGLFSLVNWVNTRLPFRHLPFTLPAKGLATLLILLCFSGGLTFYDYFYRWANSPEVYQAYDGPMVELANYLISPPAEINLVIPFYLYTHASMRYLLHDTYREEVLLPPDVFAALSRQKETSLVIPQYPPADKEPLAFVWLTKNSMSDTGTAYVSAVNRTVSLLRGTSSRPVGVITDSRQKVIAQQYQIDSQDILPLFPQQIPQKEVVVNWANNLLLTGYEFVPATIEAGDVTRLLLSWKLLGYTGLKEKMFLQMLDSQGRPVGQQEIEPISRKMYRWRKESLVLEQHVLEINSDLKADLYFVRLGFFDPQTGGRLPVYTLDGQSGQDELIVGPLYVRANGVNPIEPQHPIRATLEDKFELLGYSVYSSGTDNSTEVELCWQTLAPVDVDFTVFVQVLNPQNQIIAQADAQPLEHIYPTSRWQRGDIISARFVLPIAENELLKRGRLVTGMYDLSSGAQLSSYNYQGKLWPNGLIELTIK